MKKIKHTCVLLLCSVVLSACAASDLSRNAENNADQMHQSTTGLFSNVDSRGFIDSYQSSSQTSKGLLFGGATGAIIGGLSSGSEIFPGFLVGAILGGALGAYIDSHATLVDQLYNHGVRMIILGDQVLIVLPSSRVFRGMTGDIRSAYYPTLNLVAKFIAGLTKIGVKVSAYSNDTGSPQIERAVTQEQAESVAKYLWRAGINARLIYPVGMGSSRLVSENKATWQGDNYRIEITLEKIPLYGD